MCTACLCGKSGTLEASVKDPGLLVMTFFPETTISQCITE